jgi:two-component system phosphate regulon sensor histidine kinase PhoR
MTTSANGVGPGAPPRTAATMSLAARLRWTFAALVGVVTVVGLAGAMALYAADNADVEVDRVAALAAAHASVRQELTELHAAERSFLLTGGPGDLDRFNAAIISWHSATIAVRSRAERDANPLAALDEEERRTSAWLDQYARPITNMRRNDPATAATLASSDSGEQLYQDARAAADRAAAAIAVQRGEAVDHQRDVARAGIAVLLLLLFAGGCVAVALLQRTTGAVLVPLRELRRSLAGLTAGHHAVRMPVDGPEEVAVLGTTANELADQVEYLRGIEQRRADQERTIGRLSRTIRQHLDVAEVLVAAARELGEALDVDRVVIREAARRERSADQPLGRVVAAWGRASPHQPGMSAPGDTIASGAPAPAGAGADGGWGPATDAADVEAPTARATVWNFAEWCPPLFADLVETAFADRALLAVDDTQRDERLDAACRRWFATGGIRSVVVAPVAAGEVTYLLVVQSRFQGRVWSDLDLTLLGATARDVGVALHHARLYEQERRMVSELVDLDHAKAEFASSVSRELRTPLTTIVGYTQLLREGDAGSLNDAQDEMLAVIEQGTEHLLALIDDLLIVSHLEAGSLTLRPGAVAPAALAAATAAAADAPLRPRRLHLTVDVPPDLPALWVDLDQMSRALVNVIRASARAAPDGEHVSIAAAAHDDVVTFAVTAGGSSAPCGSRPRSFAVVTDQDGGTALGLTMARLVVEGHGGSVVAVTTPRGGAGHEVHLPVHTADAGAPEPGTEGPGALRERGATPS